MKIGDLARAAGVSATAVRYYESIGLLPEPERTSSGYRDYGHDAVDLLHFIRDAQAAGLTLAETREIVQMKASGEATCAHTRALVERHLEDVAAQIEALKATQAELLELHRRAESLDPTACSDPHRCQVIALDLEVGLKV